MSKRKLTLVILILVALIAVLTLSACKSDTPFKGLDKSGYTVSVKFLANGGTVKGQQDISMLDVYNLANAKTDDNGNKLIKILPNDSELRGQNAFTIQHLYSDRYYFGGWYKVESFDDNGNPVLGEKWNFDSYLTIDPNKEYNSDNPVLYLAAKWEPYFTFNIYVLNDQNQFELNSTSQQLILDYPTWDTSKGVLKYNDYPTVNGKSFDKAFTSQDMTTEITANLTEADISFVDGVAQPYNVYVTYKDGEWFNVYSAKQIKSPKANAHYVLMADLDFSERGATWAFGTMTFNGSIYGNGYKIKNIEASSLTTATYGGLFGKLGENAKIDNVVFENVSFTANGTIKNEADIGFFAGTYEATASITNVSFTNCKLILAHSLHTDFVSKWTNDFIVIGKFSASGIPTGIDTTGITVENADVADGAFEIDANGLVKLTSNG
ncbi:MAG: hypothetical protein J6R35_04070 [Clostridia bacterium]|nr:hypothetical protein [Clostridia bacterium]